MKTEHMLAEFHIWPGGRVYVVEVARECGSTFRVREDKPSGREVSHGVFDKAAPAMSEALDRAGWGTLVDPTGNHLGVSNTTA